MLGAERRPVILLPIHHWKHTTHNHTFATYTRDRRNPGSWTDAFNREKPLTVDNLVAPGGMPFAYIVCLPHRMEKSISLAKKQGFCCTHWYYTNKCHPTHYKTREHKPREHPT